MFLRRLTTAHGRNHVLPLVIEDHIGSHTVDFASFRQRIQDEVVQCLC